MTELTKLDRLDSYLATNDLETVWFATPPMFAWLTGGSNLIVREGAAGIAAAGYDGDHITVITTDIEGQRLIKEEIDHNVRLVEYPWHERSLEEAVMENTATPAAADFECGNLSRVDRSVLTQPLTDSDVKRYRTVSQETAEAVEEVAIDASPTDTEVDLAAHLSHTLHQRKIESPVVLVGGEKRVQQYRHFTPTDTKVGGYAILTVVGTRYGLNAAVTRTVEFDNAPHWLEDRYEDISRVAATMAAATWREGIHGGSAGDVFETIQVAYDKLGYGNEWQNHHQGGALGYASREWVATPSHDAPVELPMTYAWNPTVKGAKTEDTILATKDGIEVLSITGEFPTRTAEAIGIDAELTLPDILKK